MAFSFEDLEVWRRSLVFANEMFELADGLPQPYQFSLGEQLRRAALSIPTNIAEGCGRGTDTELARFFQIAMGSASELEYLLLLANELNMVDTEDFEELSQGVVETKKMLTIFIKKLRADR